MRGTRPEVAARGSRAPCVRNRRARLEKFVYGAKIVLVVGFSYLKFKQNLKRYDPTEFLRNDGFVKKKRRCKNLKFWSVLLSPKWVGCKNGRNSLRGGECDDNHGKMF